MLRFFSRVNKKRRIVRWAKLVSAGILASPELQRTIDREGILGGKRIIEHFIACNECASACEHLIYMIRESGIYLPAEVLNDISALAIGLGVPFDPTTASHTEINEFYRLLDLFHTRQATVISVLVDVLGLPDPMPAEEWLEWSNSQFDHTKLQSGTWIFPHGFGLAFRNADFYIDFDFGKNGETNGFDAYRLWHFKESNQIASLFNDKKQLHKVFNSEARAANIIFSGYINYYRNVENEQRSK